MIKEKVPVPSIVGEFPQKSEKVLQFIKTNSVRREFEEAKDLKMRVKPSLELLAWIENEFESDFEVDAEVADPSQSNTMWKIQQNLDNAGQLSEYTIKLKTFLLQDSEEMKRKSPKIRKFLLDHENMDLKDYLTILFRNIEKYEKLIFSDLEKNIQNYQNLNSEKKKMMKRRIEQKSKNLFEKKNECD